MCGSVPENWHFEPSEISKPCSQRPQICVFKAHSRRRYDVDKVWIEDHHRPWAAGGIRRRVPGCAQILWVESVCQAAARLSVRGMLCFHHRTPRPPRPSTRIRSNINCQGQMSPGLSVLETFGASGLSTSFPKVWVLLGRKTVLSIFLHFFLFLVVDGSPGRQCRAFLAVAPRIRGWSAGFRGTSAPAGVP